MLTTDQRTARKSFIGSSDAPAIMGVDPFRNAHDVYVSKVMDLDDFTNPAIEAGNRLESLLVDYAAERLGLAVASRGETVMAPDLKNLGCNLDGRFDDRQIIEAKSSSLIDGWGEDGTDQVPDKVIIQTHHAMYCTGAVIAWVPVLLGRFSLQFKLFRVDRDEKLAALVADRGMDFFTQHVEPMIPPSHLVPSLDVLKRIRRVPSLVVPVEPQLVQNVIDAKAATKAASAAEETAIATLLAAMGEGDGATSEAGDVSYLEQTRKAYAVKESSFRVLRIKQAKES